VLWNPRGEKTIIHIDSTPAEIDGYYLPAVEVVGEIGESLRGLLGLCAQRGEPAWIGTRATTTDQRLIETMQRYAADDSWPLKPQRVVADVRAALGEQDILIGDVGAHKIWLGRLYPTRRPNTVVIANGFASMGIALPGAIAAKLVFPERNVVAVSGDGGALMNMQELETAKRLGVAIVVVVLVDNRFGVIAANQMRRFGHAAGIQFGNPDFVQLARAFDLPGFAITRADELLPTLKQALALDRPALLAVPIDAGENLRLGAPL
jgi:acetolactate synthase-1/2/3 large subunit